MPWALVAQLILNIGIPATQKIIELASKNTNATPEDFNSLITLIQTNTAKNLVVAQLAAKGILPNDPQYIAMINLVS